MGGILSGENLHKIEELEWLKEKALDLTKDVVYFPVRHHSPACSYHLLKLLREYKPEAVLVEGPESADSLIGGLVSEDSVPPLSIYYTYTWKKKDEENEKYSCYYPMLQYSPEYQALKYAEEEGIFSSFIDLSYKDIIKSTEKGRGMRKPLEKEVYGDEDYLLSERFLTEVFKKSGVRDYHEYWEKYFEIRGVTLSTKEFVDEVLTHCYIMRANGDESTLHEEGCIQREIHMADRIKEAREKYEKILVVTGGFHTYGILKFMEMEKTKKASRRGKDDSEAYIIPYSYKHSDSSSGYKSGMPHTAFYGKVWKELLKESDDPYYEASKYFIAKCSRKLRGDKDKGRDGSSTDDSINALVMARGLSELRGKESIGVNEVKEGVGSSFIKGEMTPVNWRPLEVLREIMIGNKVGETSKSVDIPPIVKDFRDKCKKFRINLTSMVKGKKILQVHSKESHLMVSRFLHRINFLNCGFAQLVKGDSWVGGEDRALKRETWEYTWSPQVERALIELSVHGGTVEEAAAEVLREKLKIADKSSIAVGELFVQAIRMGMESILNYLADMFRTTAFKDKDFLSLSRCVSLLGIISKDHWAREKLEGIDELLHMVFQRAVSQMDHGEKISPQDEKEYIKSIKILNEASMESEEKNSYFIDRVENLMEERWINPAVEGTFTGILYSSNRLEPQEIIKGMEGYLKASGDERKKCAPFLKGLFSTGRDILLREGEVLELLDRYLVSLTGEDFMEILPELRYAFTSFMPREIDTIAKSVGKKYGVGVSQMTLVKGIDQVDMEKGMSMDRKAQKILKEWGVLDG